VRFKGVEVPRLTRTRLVLWNPRWAVVHREDIAESDPLRIVFREAEVLDVRLTAQTRDAISFTSEVRDGGCYILFDFLDRHDGVSLELLHTASDTARPSIQGTVKGLPAGISSFGHSTPARPRDPSPEARISLPAGILFVCLLVGGILILVAATSKSQPGAKNSPGYWEMYLAGGILIAIGLVAASVVWSRRLPRALARTRKNEQPPTRGAS
jgi:hypothetical protein